MFERFTERARQIIVLSQEEARLQKHNYIGTEHVLMGIVREEEGFGARVLKGFGMTEEPVRLATYKHAEPGEALMDGQIPFTPRAKKVMENALREAISLGHNYIGTEHLLLGLIRDHEGLAMKIIADFDTDAVKIRQEVLRILAGPGGRRVTPSETQQQMRWYVDYETKDRIFSKVGGWEDRPKVHETDKALHLSGSTDEETVIIPLSSLTTARIYRSDATAP